MVTFCGFTLELLIEDILKRDVWPTVCRARDPVGGCWIIVHVDEDPHHPAWLCAPVSPRASQAVNEGRASPLDAVRHSLTGTVELVALHNGRAIPDQCFLCSQVNELLAAFQDDQVAPAA
jgi:hypothetical protein